MTEQEMQIAVAESVGWTHIGQRIKCSSGKQLLSSGSYLGGIPPLASKDIDWEITSEPIPNYPQDLNAMHEVVETLEVGFDGSEADNFQHTLWNIVNPSRGGLTESTVMDVAYLQAFVNATAHQRCEAYLRVKGLWK